MTRRLTLLLTLLFLSSRTIASDSCSIQKQDCQAIVSAAKATLAAREKTIADQGVEITDLQTALNTSKSNEAKDQEDLDKWYHNPVILGLIGAAVGGAGVLYLERK